MNIEGGIQRVFMLITDAPPHGKKYQENCLDDYPDGCPCKLKFRELVE